MPTVYVICKAYGKLSKNIFSYIKTNKICIHSNLGTSTKYLTAVDNNSKEQPVKKRTTLAQKFVNNSPKFAYPYLKLIRFDQPIGAWLLFWPCSWGISMATCPGCLPDPYLLLLFGCGAFIMRGAGCTINDMWDKDIDKKVSRTSSRPLAMGSLKFMDALSFLGLQLSIGLAILLQLNDYCLVLGVCSVGCIVAYPLMKRFTYWPQLALGITFNYGILIGWAAVQGSCYWLACLPLYCAAISWTIIYDTIYAHQDKTDDLSIGIKSTAIRFGGNTKVWLRGFSMTMMSGLLCSGMLTEISWPYYLSVLAVGAHIFRQINTLNIDNPDDCDNKFRSNHHVGFILFLGCLLGTYFK